MSRAAVNLGLREFPPPHQPTLDAPVLQHLGVMPCNCLYIYIDYMLATRHSSDLGPGVTTG